MYLPDILSLGIRSLWIAVFISIAPAAFADEVASSHPAPVFSQALKARIGPPHPDTLAAYREAGATETRAHVLTAQEWALVEQAIESLPATHKRILEKHLARLSFVEAPASVGTALTRMYDGPNGEPLFDITLRAEVLDVSLSSFLTYKEQSLFSEDGSGLTVHVFAGDAPALPYLVLHEASHVVDRTLGLTQSRMVSDGLWKGYRELAEPYAQSLLAQSVYRRAPRLPAARSLALYTALAQSPFVSLYSTASAGEDFAELAAWSALSQRDKTPLIFEVRDRDGQVVLRVEPLKQPMVQTRLHATDVQINRP